MSRVHSMCRPGVLSLVTAQLVAIAAAQTPQAAEQPPIVAAVVPIHSAADDHGVAYGIWAAGTDYKVSFHDGATFVPYLGRDYPHNQPWHWRTASVTLGGVELATAAPRLGYHGTRAEYDLGGVVEAYDVRADGVEQTFVVSDRVAGGDLVVRGVVTSRLVADATAAAHGALSFVDHEGRELMRYGAATAVDARGARRAMTTSYENGRVTLRLDAAWLDQAAFPVVVDPLLGPGAQVAGATRYEVDSGCDPESTIQSFWVAYSFYASVNDSDLAMHRFSESGQLGSLAFTDVTASWSTRRPAVAFNVDTDRCVVAFDRYFPSSSQIRVRVHAHDRADLQTGTSFVVVPSADNAWRADIGGSRSAPIGSGMPVVWQQESNSGGAFQNTVGSDVYLAYYDSAAGTFGAPMQVTTSLFSDWERPCISEVAVSQRSWGIAYQGRSNVITNDMIDVFVRRVDGQGTLGPALRIDAGYNGHQFAPKIDGNGGRYLCAFVATGPTILAPTGVNGSKIRSVRVDLDFNGTASEPHGTVELQSNSDNRLELGGVCADYVSVSHWGVLFRSNVTDNLYLRLVGYRGRQLRAETVLHAAAGQSSVQGGMAFKGASETMGIAYAVNQSGVDYVTVDRFSYAGVGNASTSGSGCSPAAISWSGSQQIGSETSRLEVQGAAANSIHVAVLGLASASSPLNVPPFQSGCSLLVAASGPDFLGVFPLRTGSDVDWGLPLPEGLVPTSLYMQGWHTVGGAGANAFDLVGTERLVVPITK